MFVDDPLEHRRIALAVPRALGVDDDHLPATERCDGEIEIISSKSCENVYRNNTFRDSEGCLTLRHGNRCVVDGNFFLGNGSEGKPTGGVRVIGEEHVITNNYFDGTTGIAGGVIVLTAGQPKAELTGYWHITKATIAGTCPVPNASG